MIISVKLGVMHILKIISHDAAERLCTLLTSEVISQSERYYTPLRGCCLVGHTVYGEW